MVNWYSGDPSEDARKYVLRLCTVMSRRLRSKMRKLVLVLELFSTRNNLFTFSTFFSLFDMYFLLFKCLPFFFYVYKPPRNAFALAA